MFSLYFSNAHYLLNFWIPGNVGPGICVVMASYLGCNRTAAAAMFVIGMLIMGPFYSGMKVNVLDITKNFAGIIMAIVNGLGALAYFPVPSVTAMVTKNVGTIVRNIISLYYVCI